jgi:hypothetical protein
MRERRCSGPFQSAELSILTRRRLGVRLVRVGLVRFMVPTAQPAAAPSLPSRHVAGDADDDGAFNAAFRLSAGGQGHCDHGCAGRGEHPFRESSKF